MCTPMTDRPYRTLMGIPRLINVWALDRPTIPIIMSIRRLINVQARDRPTVPNIVSIPRLIDVQAHDRPTIQILKASLV